MFVCLTEQEVRQRWNGRFPDAQVLNSTAATMPVTIATVSTEGQVDAAKPHTYRDAKCRSEGYQTQLAMFARAFPQWAGNDASLEEFVWR